MTEAGEGFQGFLDTLQEAIDTKGVSFLQEAPPASGCVKGMTLKGDSYDFCQPAIVVDRRSMADSPIALWFTKDEKSGQVKLNYQLLVKPAFEGKQPFLLTNLKLEFRVEDGEGKITRPRLTVGPVVIDYPQRITGAVFISLREFSYLKGRLEEDFMRGDSHVSFYWTGDVLWVPLDKLEVYSGAKDSNERRSLLQKRSYTGTVPVSIQPDDKNVYEGVRSLLDWDHEIIESGSEKYEIWFKDTMEDNTYYFLPQIYRIKANPHTNAPKMTITFVKDPNADATDSSSYKVRMNFEMAPYYHPRAERDLYRVMKNRSGGRVKICNIRYGGYESATFRMQTSEGINAAYNQLGVKPLIEGEIQTNPDSSFRVALESSMDCYNKIREDLCEGDIYIGDVNVSVNKGLEEELQVIPLTAYLDLKKLTGHNIGIKPLESTDKKIKFPHEVELTNNGVFPLEIGGCELSMLSEKKKVARNVMHELKTDTPWPILLEPGESRTIALKSCDIQTLNKKNTFLGINSRKYWTTLICQPYSVRLPKEYIEGILDDVQDSATSKMEVWHLKIVSFIDWSMLPTVDFIEVQVKNDRYSVDETVVMDGKKEISPINMCGNLTAILQSQFTDNRVFKYRIRVHLKDRTTNWGAFHEDMGNSLYIEQKLITDLVGTL